jgi:partner of Y14 and mago protein
MARPPLFPDQSAAGIAIDPRTLERVIPESKRSDGTYVRPSPASTNHL